MISAADMVCLPEGKPLPPVVAERAHSEDKE